MIKSIVFAAPHTNISGGVKVICTLAQLFSAQYKTAVVFNHLSDPFLGWLFNGSSYCFSVGQRSNFDFYDKFDCIIEFMDNDIEMRTDTPRVLFMQGYNKTAKESSNLNVPFKLVVATSQWLADLAFQRGQKNVVVIPPGVQNHFLTCGDKTFYKKVVIGSLFHKFALKNSNTFISVMNSIVSRSSLPLSLLLLSAAAPDNVSQHSLRLKCDWNVAPRQERLPKIYDKCSIWVSPSLREGFGLTTVEAMACGVPVVWVRSGGLNEYMVDGENCLIVEPSRMPDALGRAVLRLIEDTDLARRLSVNGQKTARQFTWDRCFQSFRDAVEKVC